MIVWPILNATGFLGALFAYLFLGEKLKPIDFFYIFSAFLITGLVVISLNYEKF
jgi:drug/metabolite transporter (DMT)-like permease